MYLGQVVEHGASEAVLAAPKHPYTRLLLDSIPTMRATGGLGEALSNTDLPSNRNLPTGGFFKDRCEQAGVGCDLRLNMVPTEQAQMRCCQTTAATPQQVSA